MQIFLKLWSGVWNRAYLPICRAYAKYVVRDKPADRIMSFLCSLYFMKKHGYQPHFGSPQSFQEKTWRRMLFDRNPLWTMLSDKLSVRDYVASRAGSECLVPLYWTGDDPEQIPFARLPIRFILKTNHGCGYNLMVTNKHQLNQAKAKQCLTKWLSENYCQDKLIGAEWGYRNIKPKIIVESLLDDNGGVPADYKFFCFAGKVEFFKIDFDRFKDHSEAFFDRELKPLDILGQGIKPYRGKVVLPHNYRDMVRVAESIARGIDFIRVDLYSVSGRVYFGELTCYHGGGMIRLYPRKYDFLFGEKWKYANSARNLMERDLVSRPN